MSNITKELLLGALEALQQGKLLLAKQKIQAALVRVEPTVTPEMWKHMQDTADKLDAISKSRAEREGRLIKLAAQPDCRTCSDYAHDDDHPQCKLWNACTNGDKYEAAPSVVLWRTE